MIALDQLEPHELPYVHLSTLWNAPRDAFARQIRELQQHAALITLTEMGDDWRVRFVHDLPGWGAIAHKDNAMGECAILWDRDVLAYRQHAIHPMTQMQVRTSTGFVRAPVAMAKGIFTHRTTDRNIVASVLHQVSGIESEFLHYLRGGRLVDHQGDRLVFRTPPSADHRVEVAMDVFRGIHRRNATIRRNHPKAAKIQAADFNLNLELPLVRDFIETVTGMSFPERAYGRVTGTHGTRTIDGVLLEDCRPAGQVVEFPTLASDHDGLNGVIDLRRHP